MRRFIKRDSKSVVKSYGYVELSAACVKANETGYFSLSERVNPESYDGDNTNINRAKLFFGGRRIDIALELQDASKAAAKSVAGTPSDDDGNGVSSGENSSSA